MRYQVFDAVGNTLGEASDRVFAERMADWWDSRGIPCHVAPITPSQPEAIAPQFDVAALLAL